MAEKRNTRLPVKKEADEQESHESGIVSPEKNKILEEHMRKYPEGDPAVRRVNPSRDEIGRVYHRSDKMARRQGYAGKRKKRDKRA